MIQDYDKEDDIMFVHWGNQTEFSIDLFEGNVILDIDKEDNIVGIEIFNFMKEKKKHDLKMRKIFGRKRKCG